MSLSGNNRARARELLGGVRRAPGPREDERGGRRAALPLLGLFDHRHHGILRERLPARCTLRQPIAHPLPAVLAPLFGGGRSGAAHMKNKFCENCRASIAVDETRVRAVATELSTEFYNTSMSGFWNTSHRVPGR